MNNSLQRFASCPMGDEWRVSGHDKLWVTQ